jgi:hypothetical protein
MVAAVTGQVQTNSPGFDVRDYVMLRQYYEALRSQKLGERSTWDPHWDQLRAYFEPRGTRFNTSDANQGSRQDYEIINEEGMLALDILASGMLTGMSNPTLEWFKIGLEDEAANKLPAVRQWCEDVEDILRRIFVKSNFYQTLLQFYREQGLYGTSAFLIEEDRDPDPRRNATIRCIPYPIGEYSLGLDQQLRVDLAIREVSMTARQVVEKYGYDRVSRSTRTLNDSPSGGVKEQRRRIVHIIHRNTYLGDQADRLVKMPWVSCQYELDSYDQDTAITKCAGYWENPLIAGRWYVNGENAYGESPAMRVLGSNKSLQSYEDRQALGLERMINPTMLSGADVDTSRYAALPGDIIPVDAQDVTKVFAPAYQIDFGKAAEVVEQKIARIVDRIKRGLFVTAFQAITDLDRRQMTAEETRARINEQIQILGPVVERNVEESLTPAVVRTLGIAFRKQMLPPMPKEMHGARMKIGFESILAAAQRMKRGTNITTFFAWIGQEVAVDQGIMDNVDIDEAARELADIYQVPNKILRSEDEVAKIRKSKAEQQAAAQRAEQAPKLAQAAQTMASIPADGGANSLLSKVMPAMAGGQQ